MEPYFIRLFKTFLSSIVFIAITATLLIFSSRIERLYPEYRSLVAFSLGWGIGFVYLRLVKLFFKKLKIKESGFQSRRTWSEGAFQGMLVLILSYLFLVLFKEGKTDLSLISPGILLDQLAFQVRPAIIEEVGFRFGIVTYAIYYLGTFPALIFGAIPFGLLHLLNFVSGEAIYWDYIIGTSIAGLFLSSVYLRYGLFGAVMAHYVWNVFASSIAKISSFSQHDLEAGYFTYLVLICFSLYNYFKFKNEKAT